MRPEVFATVSDEVHTNAFALPYWTDEALASLEIRHEIPN